MRIIAGAYRGRTINAPKGDTTRPTADRTRETLFSMLTSRLGSFDQLRVLDLFAGSGALGLEALSRGAGHCTFVEQDRAALDALRANARSLGVLDQCDIRGSSVLSLGPANQAYDLILLDPPYASGAGEVAVDKLMRLGWIGPASWISLETGKSDTVDVRGCTVDADRVVGKARITLLRPIEQ